MFMLLKDFMFLNFKSDFGHHTRGKTKLWVCTQHSEERIGRSRNSSYWLLYCVCSVLVWEELWNKLLHASWWWHCCTLQARLSCFSVLNLHPIALHVLENPYYWAHPQLWCSVVGLVVLTPAPFTHSPTLSQNPQQGLSQCIALALLELTERHRTLPLECLD